MEWVEPGSSVYLDCDLDNVALQTTWSSVHKTSWNTSVDPLDYISIETWNISCNVFRLGGSTVLNGSLYVLISTELQCEASLPLGDLLGYSVMYKRYSNTNSEFLNKTLKSTTGNLTAKFNKSGFPLFVIAYVKMKLREPRAIAAFVLRCYECTGGHVV